MLIKTFLLCYLIFLNACTASKPFQPPPHPADLWIKEFYSRGNVFASLTECGWIEPKYSLTSTGEIDMNLYAQVEKCMQAKDFKYIGKNPLICSRSIYKDLPNCKP